VRLPRPLTLLRVGLLGCLLVLVLVVACAGWTRRVAAGHVYPVEAVPPAPVALVLGAQVDRPGQPSAFLAARLELARRLYAEGTVRAILVSGDFGQPEYDEPDTMRAWLVGHGVPQRKVVADYAGFDTYDSCVRARAVFGVHRAIVVTQGFHVPRAVALCRSVGVVADGVGDDSARTAFPGLWLRGSLREQGACVKAAWDVATGREPVFLGRHETGVEDAVRS
jgi:vancomycin permeability regulator SanA